MPAISKKTLAGKKVFLRPPAKADSVEFIKLNRQSAELHRSLVSPPKTPEQYNSFLERSRSADSACFLICRIADGTIIGSINLSQIFRGGFKSAYLGYYIGQRYAGQGLMTEAIQLMLRYTFEILKLHRLEANIQPSNTWSIALVKRAGFVREGFSKRYLKISGRWRDHERWAITVEDWSSMHNGRRR